MIKCKSRAIKMTDHNNIFTSTYNDYHDKACMFVRRYVNDPIEVEDIVNDAMIKLWNAMKNDDVDSPGALLFTILRNTTINHLRHQALIRKAHASISNEMQREIQLRITLLENSPSSETQMQEIIKIASATLDTLPELTRSIFMMSRSKNMTYREIAEETDLNIKTVEYHVSKALAALRLTLHDYLPVFLTFISLGFTDIT